MTLRDAAQTKLNETELEHARLEAKMAGTLADSEDLEHRGYLEGYRDALGWVIAETAIVDDLQGLKAATGVAERRLGTKRSTTVREIIAAYMGARHDENAMSSDQLEQLIGQPLEDHQADWHTGNECYRYTNCPLLAPPKFAVRMKWVCRPMVEPTMSPPPCSPATGGRAGRHQACGWE